MPTVPRRLLFVDREEKVYRDFVVETFSRECRSDFAEILSHLDRGKEPECYSVFMIGPRREVQDIAHVWPLGLEYTETPGYFAAYWAALGYAVNNSDYSG